MRFIVTAGTLLLTLSAPPIAGQADVFGGVTQQAVDKVIHDVRYPVVLVRKDTLHEKHVATARTITLTADQIQAYLSEASARGCPSKDAELACALKKQADELERRIAQAKTQRTKAGAKWAGEDDAALEAKARGCFESKIVISHLAVALLDPPGMKVGGAALSVSDVHLDTDVTLQLWTKLPEWVCDTPCPIIKCCWGHFKCGAFQLVLTVPVRDVKTTTSAVVDLTTSGAKVLGTPHLTKLEVQVPVIGPVDLTALVNLFLKPKQILIYDAGSLVASVPVLKTSYGVKSITLSGQTELRVDVSVEKKPAVSSAAGNAAAVEKHGP